MKHWYDNWLDKPYAELDNQESIPPIITKSYRGSPSGATALFKADAIKLAKKGYYPTSTTWTPGVYSCGDFLGALILCSGYPLH